MELVQRTHEKNVLLLRYQMDRIPSMLKLLIYLGSSILSLKLLFSEVVFPEEAQPHQIQPRHEHDQILL